MDFASNDYLSFARNAAVVHTPASGATGSRLLSGNSPRHEELEKKIAGFHNSGAALLFNSGYDANLGLLSSIADRHDLIIYDELVHASIRDGILLSKAKSLKFKHNDLAHLKILINKFQEWENRVVYVVTESIFSMDGDQPDLLGMLGLVNLHPNVRLIVDEAHAIGIIGKKGEGLVSVLGVENQIFARVITFGKSMGAHGAAIVGDEYLKEYLINFARSFIYTTALPGHTIASVINSYEKLAAGDPAVDKIKGNIAIFKKLLCQSGLKQGVGRFRFRESATPIQICIIPNNFLAQEAARYLQSMGYDVRAILSPTVPAGQERLRICLHAHNTKKEMKSMLTYLKEFLKNHV